MKTSKIISVGFAMFGMLFGAGNVVFPLILGRDVGDKLWFGLMGFVLTAVIVPLIGLVSTMLCDGEYKKFLGRMGKIPGFLAALICMILIGPFGMTPRCITISHAGIKLYTPQFTLLFFSIFSAALIYICTRKEGRVVNLIGRYLGPLKLIMLLLVVIKGLFAPPQFAKVAISEAQGFLTGLLNGYWTVDLLGTIFFSGLILMGLRQGLSHDDSHNYKKLAMAGLKAGGIGALLLGLVYAGFCVVAGFYGHQLVGVERGDIFSVTAALVLGGFGGMFANITVTIACLTTAIALTTVFARYLQRELFNERIKYHSALVISILITAVMSNLGFGGIMTLAEPIIMLIYPSLIVLAFANAAYKLFGFKMVKTPVAITFLLTVYFTYFW